MDKWTDIRRKARACHVKALEKSGGDRRAPAILKAALENDDLELRHYGPGTVFSEGVLGTLDRDACLVNVAICDDKRIEHVVIAHEIGHYHLHHDPTNEVSAQPIGLGGDPIEGGSSKVEGYSPREQKEVQADIFAGELLCPSDWLLGEYRDHKRRPSAIAHALQVPESLVVNQMIRALLLPPIRDQEAEEEPRCVIDLDPDQKAAAEWSGGALLVDAGPGTGKTRTLIRRIENLLDGGVNPGEILALTFSNKAAEEMRERLAASKPDAAIEMAVSTFHAFGLELILKWPSGVGRSTKVRVLDEAEALALLEQNLEELPLRYYRNLYEPAYELVHVLKAISRAKDELISPADYLAAARAALLAAQAEGDAEKIEAAGKAIELAQIYEIYDRRLEAADALDFGDLVGLTAKLVNENAGVRQFVSKFKHVLVDEYQDVNLASARLLEALCRFGASAWVVADQRQSIYRFRGAEPSNVARFIEDFQGETISLSHNYRSYKPIVGTFAAFSGSMGQGSVMRGSWNASRADGGEVSLTIAPTLAAEAEAICDRIETYRNAGIAYSDQAILARTHLTLARITGVLEKLGVPLLYLGDLFEREEIRDLLCLMSLGAEPGDVGFIRVATLPAYQATRNDALAVYRWARTNGARISAALSQLDEIQELTDQGRTGLAKLGREIAGLDNLPPWIFLTTWLLERSDYLEPLIRSRGAHSQQKLIAIYHLLKVCSEQELSRSASRRDFLARVRRLEVLNQDSSFRIVASEASGLDAVRVTTIHGSKGLEFGAVHFPALATRYMPTTRQPVRCPPPPSLSQLVMQPSDHEAEEECLFFVGLSRARDRLSISRAERYTSQNVSASKFLTRIGAFARQKRFVGSGKSYAAAAILAPPGRSDRYLERDLSTYLGCPLRYRYEVLEELRGGSDNSPYLQFHRCVRATINWMEAQREIGAPCGGAAALARLDQEWAKRGPIGGFENFYRAEATEMIEAMQREIAREEGQYDREEWVVSVNGCEIAVTPDRVIIDPNGSVRVVRIRTGRKTKTEANRPIYGLFHCGVSQRYRNAPATVETFYVSTGERVESSERDADKKIREYEKAIEEIERGDFSKNIDARRCPNCPFYFLCGA